MRQGESERKVLPCPTVAPRCPHHLTGTLAKIGGHPGYILVPASLHQVQWQPSQTRHASITAWLPICRPSPQAGAQSALGCYHSVCICALPQITLYSQRVIPLIPRANDDGAKGAHTSDDSCVCDCESKGRRREDHLDDQSGGVSCQCGPPDACDRPRSSVQYHDRPRCGFPQRRQFDL